MLFNFIVLSSVLNQQMNTHIFTMYVMYVMYMAKNPFSHAMLPSLKHNWLWIENEESNSLLQG